MALIPVTLAQILPREPTNKALQLDVILIRVVLVPKGGELIDYDPCDDIDHDFHHQYLLQVIKGPSRIVNVLKVGRIRVTKKSPNRPSFLILLNKGKIQINNIYHQRQQILKQNRKPTPCNS